MLWIFILLKGSWKSEERNSSKKTSRKKKKRRRWTSRWLQSHNTVWGRGPGQWVWWKIACVRDARECNERVTFSHPLFGPFPSLSVWSRGPGQWVWWKIACVRDARECNERVTFSHPLFGPFPSLSKFCNPGKVKRLRQGIGVVVSG